MRLTVLFCAIAIIALAFVIFEVEQFFYSIGPADLRVEFFAREQIKNRYGTPNQGSGFYIWSFAKEGLDTASGTYKIGFHSDSHQGYIYCHYDAASNGFTVLKIDASDN
jgi:hypothetical protein